MFAGDYLFTQVAIVLELVLVSSQRTTLLCHMVRGHVYFSVDVNLLEKHSGDYIRNGTMQMRQVSREYIPENSCSITH